MVETGKRIRKGVKPIVVARYYELKMELNVAHQMSSYNSGLGKLRWYHKVAMDALLGSATVSAWLSNKSNQNITPRPMSITKSQESMYLALMGFKRRNCAWNCITAHNYLKQYKKLKGVEERCVVCYKNVTTDEKKNSYNVTKVAIFFAKCTRYPFMCKTCIAKIHT